MARRFFAFNFYKPNDSNALTQAEQKLHYDQASKFDVYPLGHEAWSFFDYGGDPSSEFRKRNANCNLLMWINMGWVSESGTQGANSIGYAGDPDDNYEESMPYQWAQYKKSQRCWREPSQFARLYTGGHVHDAYAGGIETALPDMTDFCPRGSDGLTFREWLVDYLVTGIALHFDIDGFMFDEFHSNHANAWATGDIDLDRDGVAETSTEWTEYWQKGNEKFLQELRSKLDTVGLTGFKLWFNGNYVGQYEHANGVAMESFPDHFVGMKWYQATGLIHKWTMSGLDVCLNNWLSSAACAGTTITGINNNLVLHRGIRYTVSTAYMFDDGVMASVDSGNIFHTNIWYPEQYYLKFENPLTDVIATGSMYYRLYENGIAVVNTGSSSANFHGQYIWPTDGLLAYSEQGFDYGTGQGLLDHGFSGIKGTGVGNHMNHPGETIDGELMNKMERAVDNISKMLKYNNGPFQIQTSGMLTFQYFLGDGETRKFPLKKGVDKWMLDGYNITGGDPHPYFNLLTDKNPDTGLYHSIEFNEPPTSGEYMLMFYRRGKGSHLNTAAYLGSG